MLAKHCVGFGQRFLPVAAGVDHWRNHCRGCLDCPRNRLEVLQRKECLLRHAHLSARKGVDWGNRSASGLGKISNCALYPTQFLGR